MRYEEHDWADDDEERYYDIDDTYSTNPRYRITQILEDYLKDERYAIPEYRKKIWSEIRDKIEQLIIELYHQGIEDEISELVAGLNIFGVMTDASCEGHFFRGVYIQKIDGNEVRKIQWKSPWIGFEYKPDELKLEKLRQLIDEFYKNREVEKKYMIALYSRQGLSKGYHGIAIDDDSKKEMIIHNNDDVERLKDQIEERVKRQQQEIRTFTAFLKRTFVQTGFL